MSLYDKYILPKLLNSACGSPPVEYQRKKVVPLCSGEVLEIGIGSGLNLPFYNLSHVKTVRGIDPSKELQKMALKKAFELGMEIDFMIGGAEEIPLPSNSIDTVLLTYTLCTIPEPDQALKEMKRVLKDKGRLIFCEHGKAPDEEISKWQKRINPFWKKIAGGCNLNRDITGLIERSGFKIDELDNMYLPNTPKIAAFNYWGSARL